MADPDEGMAPGGAIQTGARRDRVPAIFEPVLADAVGLVRDSEASLYVYGSVASGTARRGSSDVDLLSIGISDVATMGERLSAFYADRCRGVEIAPTSADDYVGDGDPVYGNRVFLRHYCVHLTGPDPAAALPAFAADARAARGFNGDLDRHLRRWRVAVEDERESANELGMRVARKTLLAVAGLVSVYDHTWTTDRSQAAQRWSVVEPSLAAPLRTLQSWAEGTSAPSRGALSETLAAGGSVAAIVEQFASIIGLWDRPE